MKQMILGWMLLIAFYAGAQNPLKGVVVDESNKPVARASVFLNNTSVGTATDAEGRFVLHIPQGKYELIVSSIGYVTHNTTISSTDLPPSLNITLKLKAQELETVVIEPFEKNGWERWGNFFLQSFIGTSAQSRNCKLLNPKALRFRNSKSSRELTAIALEPLLIENKALGYTIRYQMEHFSYNFNTQYLLYSGYPFFEPMAGGPGKQKKWEERRNEVYYGSMMHFMRSLYRNQLKEEGFEARRLAKHPNTEKKRVREKMIRPSALVSAGGPVTHMELGGDSGTYYRKVLQQDDYISVVSSTLLTGDSVAYAVDSSTAGLHFEQYLLITYAYKASPREYQETFPKSTAMQSQLTLLNERGIEIQANGSYFNPVDLLSLGYWAWSEKMATMLPFDFKPTQPLKKE